MAENEITPLTPLLDPPLADSPPMADLERRAARLRQRRWAGRGAGAAAAIALVAGGITLAGPGGEQTVRTAAPATGGQMSGSQAASPESVTVQVQEFDLGGRRLRLMARVDRAGACFDLRDGGNAVAETLGCQTLGDKLVHAGVDDVAGGRVLTGITSTDVTGVRLDRAGAPAVALTPATPVLAASFVSALLPPDFESVDLVAATATNPEAFRMTLPGPVHRRIDSINGIAAPASPPTSTATATTRPPATTTPTAGPTTPAPDTPVSTSVPLTPTTIPGPPPGGNPQRVQVTPGATDLRRHQFESAFASGASSVAVRFWDGVEPCSVLGRVDVAETPDKVTITIWTGIGPGAERMACTAQAVYKEVLVPLSAPLGTRTIVDGGA